VELHDDMTKLDSAFEMGGDVIDDPYWPDQKGLLSHLGVKQLWERGNQLKWRYRQRQEQPHPRFALAEVGEEERKHAAAAAAAAVPLSHTDEGGEGGGVLHPFLSHQIQCAITDERSLL